MEERPVSLTDARRILALARTDRRAAQIALETLPVEQQLAAVCEAPPAQRVRILSLMPAPEELIPLLPEAELCFTAKAVGMDDASWLMTYATPSQVTACVDLDGWAGLEPDRSALDRWLATLAEAGEETLLQAAQTLDPELIVLYLRDHTIVMLDPNDDDWEPPPGAHTLEGQFYLLPKKEGDDLEPLLKMLHVLFRNDYWLYFRMLQGSIWELESELEEWALRWRTGRLEDLGFPSWDEGMRIYGFIRPERRAELADAAIATSTPNWDLPVWIPELPARVTQANSLFRAIGELAEDERRAAFYAFVSLANKIAVADRMPLGDAETLPRAIEKAASIASHGLDWIGAERSLPLADVLRRTTLDNLFRVGASLDRSAALESPPK